MIPSHIEQRLEQWQAEEESPFARVEILTEDPDAIVITAISKDDKHPVWRISWAIPLHLVVNVFDAMGALNHHLEAISRDILKVFCMKEEDLYEVAVWANGSQCRVSEIEQMSHLSDDYEVRKTRTCPECDEELQIDYALPFATCSCGTTEWYK